jgi:hypothetical protein
VPRWLVWTISVVGFALIGRWTINSALVVLGPEINYPDWFRASRDYVEIGVATGILGTIAYYEGPTRIGFAGTTSINVRQSLQGIFVVLGLGQVVYEGFARALMGAVRHGILPYNNFVVGSPNEAPDVFHHILWSIHAGWVEEIIVVGLTFFLLKRAPRSIGGKPLWMTGWATAITIAVRVSYHTYQGLMIIPMILLGWLFVRLYRTTGTIIPLITVHVMWDVFDLIAHTRWQQIVVLVSVYVLSELITKGTGEFSGLGSPNFPYRDDRWHGYYWARWRWEKTPEFPRRPQL